MTGLPARQLQLAFALGLYWAFSLCMPSIGFFWENEPGTQWFWLADVIAHAVSVTVLAILFARMHNTEVLSNWVIPAVLATLSVLMLWISHLFSLLPIAYFASAMLGISSSFFLVLIILYLRQSDTRFLLALLTGATAISLVYVILVICTPLFVKLLLLTGTPLVIARLLLKEPLAFICSDSGFHNREHLSLPVTLMICALLFSFGMSFYQGDTADKAGPGGIQAVLSCSVFFFILLIYAGILAAKYNKTSLFSFMFASILAAGLLLLPFLQNRDTLVSGTLIYTGKSAFMLYIFAILLLEDTSSGKILVQRFAAVIVANDIGHCLGSVIAHQLPSSSSEYILGICIAVAFLVLNLGFMLSYSERGRYSTLFGSLFTPDTCSYLAYNTLPPTGSFNSVAAEKTLAMVANTFGLSAREHEVLKVLVTGETFNTMAQDLGISYNTIKTHVAHIYQKAGVNTREELLGLVKQAEEGTSS